ncbi:hypothetical protein AB8E81_25895, partial [Salmonella enterica]
MFSYLTYRTIQRVSCTSSTTKRLARTGSRK